MHVGYWADGAAWPTILGGRYEQLEKLSSERLSHDSRQQCHCGSHWYTRLFPRVGTDRPTQSGDNYRVFESFEDNAAQE